MNPRQFHVALLGDSIFDNAAYVPGGHAVIDQLRSLLRHDCRASLVARDGDVTNGVIRQLDRLPGDVTDLVLSFGGNDALAVIPFVSMPVTTINGALGVLSEVRLNFRKAFRGMLTQALSRQLPLAVCTIYEAVPGLTEELRTALSMFNDTIVREALAARLTILDLRQICSEAADYSAVSPIEPSEIGGGKIAAAILSWLEGRSG